MFKLKKYLITFALNVLSEKKKKKEKKALQC